MTDLICTSSSGSILASAIATQIYTKTKGERNLNILYVKKNEWSFRPKDTKGITTVGALTYPTDHMKTCFVDDLIDTCHSFKACNKYVKKDTDKYIDCILVTHSTASNRQLDALKVNEIIILSEDNPELR